MKKDLLFKAIILSLFAFVACTNDVEIAETFEPTDIKSIEVTAKDFDYDNLQTRTVFEITESGAEFKWAANDTVGIFPDAGAQAYFPMTSGAGTNKASFTGGGWALKASSTYAAYYPFIGSFYIDKEVLPINYNRQTQIGNASTAHLGDYDYMAALASTPSNGNVSFNFEHLGALVRIQLKLENATTYTQLKLESEGLFIIDGSLNVLTQEITPSQTSNTFTLDLEELTTTADNNTLELYFMLAPTDLSASDVIATIIDSNNNSTTKVLAGRNFVAGRAYNLTETTKINVNTMGTLGTLLSENQKAFFTELTLTGEINKADFEVMKNEMPNLHTINLKDVTCENNKIPSNAFGDWDPSKANQTISTIIFPDNITTIGREAFSECSGLTGTLNLPAGLIEIRPIAFSGCTGLTGELNLPDGLIKIGSYAFNDCSSLSGVLTIPNGVTVIGNSAFAFCSGLTGSLTLPDGIIIIEQDTFRGCSGLTGKLSLPANLERIYNFAFGGCSSLTGDLIVPDNVIDIRDNAFYSCDEINSFQFPHTTPLTYTSSMLPTSAIVSVPSSAVEIYRAAEGWKEHPIIAINASDVVYNVTKMGTLGTMLNQTQKDTITTMVVIGEINKADFEVMNSMPNLKRIDFKDVTCEDNRIPRNAFSDNKKITSIILPSNITVIEGGAFSGCINLSGALKLPDSLESIWAHAFIDCSSLSGVLTIPNGVTVIGNGAFAFCSGLTGSLTLPDGIIIIEQDTFRGCSGLTGKLSLPANLERIYNFAFGGCSSLTGDLIVPDNVIDIRDNAFYSCDEINSFQFPHTTPLTYTSSMLPTSAIVSVPSSAVATYKAAEGWKNHNIVGY